MPNHQVVANIAATLTNDINKLEILLKDLQAHMASLTNRVAMLRATDDDDIVED